ncbi:UDP-N-acetylmuramoyl-L-alanine--D-glutamate ligase [Yinghuangia seranimata]|uniref:UDP-N-acetylmuramoyl-L-alanine--D-glutamate ligase n=1 Tax=Yinghuangia seranimata TaxID=408067 RepID=UPI00248D2655|nr:UDP-N-acetylmuramoyl-L-alanine--D-glutamate ligase [Yinghuangia seranimata]MDI2126187.1 UDP-N-acetylmuramoyl-L-alanine--D-glutamate ligase [Yinghuangia seranimata]
MGDRQVTHDPAVRPDGRDLGGFRDDTAPWGDLTVCVAGAGVSGRSVVRALRGYGTTLVVVDGSDDTRARANAAELEELGATVRLGDADTLPDGVDVVVTSPGWRPDAPLFGAAAKAGVPVWGDVELAWRLRPREGAAPWLAITGTNGKTTTVRMLASILEAAGLRTEAVGNVGTPVLDAVVARDADGGPAHDVLALELSSFQLHWLERWTEEGPGRLAPRMRAAAVLNVAPDHLDWHGSAEAYAADKGRIFEGAELACVYNTADPETERLVREAEVTDGCRAIGFGLGAPGPSGLGVVEDLLVDRAFVADTRKQAVELAQVADVVPTAPHNVANALAAAALARAHGVTVTAVREGLRAFRPDAHRIAHVATVDGVDYVDDSKATNGHAAAASLAAYPSIVWVAGGLAKGAEFDGLVSGAREHLRAAVLIGQDRAVIRDALERHAPDVPVIEVDATDTGAMETVVRKAAELARPGDTVLLAPACASMDMFANYGARGDAFAAAVHGLLGDAS